jgi:type IV pilus assembly protein PilP
MSGARGGAALVPCLLAAALAGCGSDRAELRAWMDETRRAAPRTVEPLPEPRRFEPFRYRAEGESDPFGVARLKVAADTPGAAGPRPDPGRRREPLEAYPLDALRMVGHLRQGAAQVALVAADSLLFQVRVGQHVGPNHGRVLRISESGVAIREIVQDAAGDWVERDVALQLQAQEGRK